MFVVAFAGGPDTWLIASRGWSCHPSAIATNDGPLLIAHEFCETRRAFLAHLGGNSEALEFLRADPKWVTLAAEEFFRVFMPRAD